MEIGPAAASFRKKLLNWYAGHKRMLPWRATSDPYKIWISEIILQQTRVAQGLPYYERFVSTFPTVERLANAKEEEVLRVWQGLGYYSRARNMHRCARKVATEHGNQFPDEYEGLLLLPGIGPYTAAAIASIAFRQPVAVVDGNVFRVLARVFGIDQDVTTQTGRSVFATKANELIPKENPGDFNQALMEFGALQCTPHLPDCQACPFARVCVAKATNRVSVLPVKARKTKVRKRFFTYFICRHKQKIAMRKRASGDIWSGLYDFYLIETKKSTTWERIREADTCLNSIPISGFSDIFGTKHLLSHQHLHIRFVRVEWKQNAALPTGFRFYTLPQVEALPKPVVISRLLEESGYLTQV